MPRIRYSPESTLDLRRFSEYFLATAPEVASKAVVAIIEAIDVLIDAPMIGRPYEMDGKSGYQELVISFGKGGYLALYRYNNEADVIDILAIRSQRELKYARF